jgi:dolichyl-phosphate-mannose--protein O-mannosyl transferase
MKKIYLFLIGTALVIGLSLISLVTIFGYIKVNKYLAIPMLFFSLAIVFWFFIFFPLTTKYKKKRNEGKM